MTARGAAGRCPPTTWLGPRLLLVCLLVSRSITEEASKHCSYMIGDQHLQFLQQMIDSQMEISCLIDFKFVDQHLLEDPVCYLKKAFPLVQDIMEEILRFRENTSNAIAVLKLQELSVLLKDCFPKDNDEQDEACVQDFQEKPLQLLEKIKNVFNETKHLLKKDHNIFSKNCNNIFAKCSSQNLVTTPDCNCLYPKATPSSDLASVPPQQPLAPSMAPMADLTWADSEGTENNPLLPTEQRLRTGDLGHAKQRPPRSTCQSFESPETPGTEDNPTGGSPQPGSSVDASVAGMEGILDSVLGPTWALEEASGEASEGPGPQAAELSSSKPGAGSLQTEATRPSDLFSAMYPLFRSARGPRPAAATGTPMPKVGPVRPTRQAQSQPPEKTDHAPALPRGHQEPGSATTLSPHLQGLSGPSTLSPQRRLPSSQSRGHVLPLGELEGKRSTRARRSPAEQEGGRAGAGAAGRAHVNPVPLTDAGPEQRLPQHRGFSVRSLAPVGGGILALVAVSGLLYTWRRWRSHPEPQAVDSPMEPPEGSPLTQDEDRQVELPV